MEKQIEASGFNFLNLSKNEQKATLEAIIFAAEEPITIKSLFSILVTGDKLKSSKKLSEEKELVIESDELKNKQKDYNDFFIDLINEINEELISTNRPFRIVEIAGGFQYATRPEFGMYIEKLFSNKIKKRLTQYLK